MNNLRESQEDSTITGDQAEDKNENNDNSISTRSLSVTQSLNRTSRRKFAKELLFSTKNNSPFSSPGSPFILKRRQARPPGCTFLGAKAITTKVCLMKENHNSIDMVIDSGSDITLISENYLKKMEIPPKPKTGQKINLIQLTGATAITGYVNIPIYFGTPEGSVQMDIEAYVVKGMTTPIILGNDFADQFDLSLLRQDGQTRLLLGDSKRSVPVANSTSPFMDEQGRAFRVHTIPEANSKCFRIIAHKRNKRIRKKRRLQSSDPYIRASQPVHIPPETVKKVRVSTANLEDNDFHYAERMLNYQHHIEDCYGPPDSIITTQDPYLAVTNFSKQAITIPAGQILAIKRNPSVWLNTVRDILIFTHS